MLSTYSKIINIGEISTLIAETIPGGETITWTLGSASVTTVVAAGIPYTDICMVIVPPTL